MRENYLSQIWSKNPYPVARRGFRSGRLARLGKSSGHLISNFKEWEFRFKESLELAPGFLVQDCLKAGDIIELALDSDGFVSAITLLVPSFSKNPHLAEMNLDRATKWNRYVAWVRNYFVTAGFTELRTPTLVPSPGLEPFLDPFKTSFELGRHSKKYFLPTSPEFHLKKALVHGFEKCFEFKECFRNGELGGHHQPEFLMLEWYRSYETLDSIIEDLKNILKGLQKEFCEKEVFSPLVMKMSEVWTEAVDFPLSPKTSAAQLQDLARDLKIDSQEKDFDDLFHLIFLERVEPWLKSKPEPVIILNYPPSQVALARISQEGWADRLEVYWKGLELANAFHELNDVKEQRRRFSADQDKKKLLGKEVVPVDDELLSALEYGMPPSSGIALGVERLFMALMDLESLGQCRLFPIQP